MSNPFFLIIEHYHCHCTVLSILSFSIQYYCSSCYVRTCLSFGFSPIFRFFRREQQRNNETPHNKTRVQSNKRILVLLPTAQPD